MATTAKLLLDLQIEDQILEYLDLEFFRIVLGWKNIMNLPSFSITKGDEQGWAMLNRELQKCYMVKEVFVSASNKYLVGVQKEKESAVAIGEAITLAQATTQALIALHQGIYASKEQMQELKSALAHKYNQQMITLTPKLFSVRYNTKKGLTTMNTITNSTIANKAKYEAIGLVGRSTIDKLADNGLVVINDGYLAKLESSMHELNMQNEELEKDSNSAQQINHLLAELPNPATMTKQEIEQELCSYGFTQQQVLKLQGEVSLMIVNYIRSNLCTTVK
jgi:hypothetical protein